MGVGFNALYLFYVLAFEKQNLSGKCLEMENKVYLDRNRFDETDTKLCSYVMKLKIRVIIHDRLNTHTHLSSSSMSSSA